MLYICVSHSYESCSNVTKTFAIFLIINSKKAFLAMRTLRTKMQNRNIGQKKFFGSYCAHPL